MPTYINSSNRPRLFNGNLVNPGETITDDYYVRTGDEESLTLQSDKPQKNPIIHVFDGNAITTDTTIDIPWQDFPFTIFLNVTAGTGELYFNYKDVADKKCVALQTGISYKLDRLSCKMVNKLIVSPNTSVTIYGYIINSL